MPWMSIRSSRNSSMSKAPKSTRAFFHSRSEGGPPIMLHIIGVVAPGDTSPTLARVYTGNLVLNGLSITQGCEMSTTSASEALTLDFRLCDEEYVESAVGGRGPLTPDHGE